MILLREQRCRISYPWPTTGARVFDMALNMPELDPARLDHAERLGEAIDRS